MYKHKKFDYVKRLVELAQNPLLEGVSGSGKTTVSKQIADALGLKFGFLNMTESTSVGNIMGFQTVNGSYAPSPFRDIYENGGLWLFDEVDAANPNTFICLNTMDNGYLAFPDGTVHAHKDFRVIYTANPRTESNIYTGRRKLDFASLNRMKPVAMPTDHNLEAIITSTLSANIAGVVRKIFTANAIGQDVTMRDTMRYHVSSQHNLEEFGEDPLDNFLYLQPQLKAEVKREVDKLIRKSRPVSDAKNINELYEMLKD